LAVETAPRNQLIIAAIIKNFEFNYELSWKAMRRLLLHHGITVNTPRQSIAESFRKNFIDDETLWLAMIEDRNLTVHTYDEAFAAQMATRISQSYLPLLDSFLKTVEKECTIP
jgi:nucleotidyltransferase substrate binding protein (TIGR01987 family)